MRTTCYLCKQPFTPDERTITEHYKCAADFDQKLIAERKTLRDALVRLVGADGRQELEQLEMVMRALPAPAADKAASIDAIHALIETLPE